MRTLGRSYPVYAVTYLGLEAVASDDGPAVALWLDETKVNARAIPILVPLEEARRWRDDLERAIDTLDAEGGPGG